MIVPKLNGLHCAVAAIEGDIDPAWDSLVEGTPGGDLAQTTLWAASRRALGFRCYRIAVTKAGQKLVGGCLLYAKRVFSGVWAGSIPRGPLVFVNIPEAALATVQEALALAQREGIFFLAIQPPENHPNVEDVLVSAGFRLGVPSLAPEATLRLDLRRADEELLAAMSPVRRRNIRKALRAQFEISEEQDIELFHRLYVMSAERQGFLPLTLRNLRAQWEALAPGAKCSILIARHKASPVAGFWLTWFAGTVTTKLAGWDKAKAPAHANEALEWAAIQWARASGAHTYDQGGFDRRSAETILAGMPLEEGFHKTPSYFKLGFGGQPILLPKARFKFTPRLADTALGPVASRFLTSHTARRIAHRMRSG
ncbi:MAG TPA: GNAT family N-acetyltransferase [Methylocella sp.]|nr:GNAT family N-acetyltransferase [Methylocella sp.]